MTVSNDDHTIDLRPGELYIAKEPVLVWTLLGSCLSVVFHNARLGIGAICHAQLAEDRYRPYMCSDFCPNPCYTDVPDSNLFKYVTCSFRYMYDQFAQFGISKDEIDVKVFGGSNMFHIRPDVKTVGAENINAAQKMIANYDLWLHSLNIGGSRGRTIYFYSHSGKVLLRKHRPRFNINPTADSNSLSVADDPPQSEAAVKE